MTEYWNYEPRRPRHQASDRSTVVEVRRTPEHPWGEASLVDISRNGIRLKNVPQYQRDETLEIRIPLADRGEPRTFSATVRWCVSMNGSFELACQCNEPLDWEVIGELVLNGALNGR